jgi:hypothetical protein
MAVALSLVLALVGCLLAPASPAVAAAPAQACTSSVGPGIPPPSTVPSGIPGFHAHWYGQSGYPTLCPGERATATVAFYNSGSFGWVRGRMGEMAFLGTWNPVPGQDAPSQLGGDGKFPSSPSTGWPSHNRIAAQPADYVGPGQVAWFQFTIQAPASAGTYFLYLRPLIEGATWMEDFGVFWQVTVKEESGGLAVTPVDPASVDVGGIRSYSATVPGAPGCVDLAFIAADGFDFEGHLPGYPGPAQLSSAATFATVNGLIVSSSFVNCVTLPADRTVSFTVTSSAPNAYVRPIVFQDLDGSNDPGTTGAEPLGLGGAVRFLPPAATAGTRTVVVGVANTDENYFIDTGNSATYRYKTTDRFRYSGAQIAPSLFEQALSRGDTIATTFDPAGESTFDITNDVGHQAPTVSATVDSWDQGPTQNDVGLRITEPPTNVDFAAYSIHRASTGAGTGCDASSGAYLQIAQTATPQRSDSVTYVDRNLAVGAYCYRVGIVQPVTAATAFGYSQRVTINNPPLPVAPPRALDARVTTSAGSAAQLDAGDVIKIAFDKAMQTPVSRQMRVQDADGTAADIRCLQSEQLCTLNAGPESLGGVTYPADTVVTVTLRTPPMVVAAGAAAGLQLNVTVISGSFVDVAGNTWDVNASEDTVIGAPD